MSEETALEIRINHQIFVEHSASKSIFHCFQRHHFHSNPQLNHLYHLLLLCVQFFTLSHFLVQIIFVFMCREQRSKTYAITQALDRYLLKSDAVCGSFGYMPLRRPRYAIGIECSTTMTNLKYFFVNHVLMERYIFSIVSLFQFFFY